MRGLTFDELFALLSAAQLSAADLAGLRECIALIEQATRGRGCPRCGCARVHRCGQAGGLQRFRGVASRYLINYSGWQRVLDAKRLTTPAHLLCAAVQLG